VSVPDRIALWMAATVCLCLIGGTLAVGLIGTGVNKEVTLGLINLAMVMLGMVAGYLTAKEKP